MVYYVKEGNRYRCVGHDGPNLYDGIWLVRSGGRSFSNIEKCLKKLPDKRDLDILAKALQLEEDICKVLRECWENGKPCSLADASRQIAVMLAKMEKKHRATRIRKLRSKKLTSQKLRRVG